MATKAKPEEIEKAKAMIAARVEQYTMSILNGMLANSNLCKTASDKEGMKALVDKAYELALYQINKIYGEQ